MRKRANAVVEALGASVASKPLKFPPDELPAGASCGSRAHADDVEDGEPAEVPGRDSPDVFKSPRGFEPAKLLPGSAGAGSRQKPYPRARRRLEGGRFTSAASRFHPREERDKCRASAESSLRHWTTLRRARGTSVRREV